ncbi:MAG TPA: histidinol-phosphate transaminase [Thermoanaerobaculia bacterium]|nr:histidinol-phosphate transaminase [Thermoanaerobaculia bacterium]
MTFSRRDFARLTAAGAALALVPAVRGAKPAAPAGPVRLSANENPYGPSPAAARALQDALARVNRYPGAEEEALNDALAKHHAVTAAELLLGNGSSDILKLAADAYLSPQRHLVTALPTFEVPGFHATRIGAKAITIPLDANHAHDLPRMLDAAKGAGLVYICNPNNPTATITPKSAMRGFLDALPPSVMVLVDEAYHHYALSPDYESVAPLIAKYPNLIVARTFSKIYGLAGLRCGYALAQKPIIDTLGEQQQFNVMNSLALVAAMASLGDEEHVAIGRKRNRETRSWLTAALAKLGFATLPSEANFVMVDLQRDAKPVIAALRERNVRAGRPFPPMPQHMRVTIGTPDEVARFVEAFAAVTSVP